MPFQQGNLLHALNYTNEWLQLGKGFQISYVNNIFDYF